LVGQNLDDKSALGTTFSLVFDIILSQDISFGRPVLWKQETVSKINQNHNDLTGIHSMVLSVLSVLLGYMYASEMISLSNQLRGTYSVLFIYPLNPHDTLEWVLSM